MSTTMALYMALACGLATNREKPIFAIMGDGAVGAGGMDIETCVRWNIPAVFLHENNNTLINGTWELFWSKACAVEGNTLHDSWETMPNIRYDKMFAEFGAHSEFVDKPEQLKPAVKRAICCIYWKSWFISRMRARKRPHSTRIVPRATSMRLLINS